MAYAEHIISMNVTTVGNYITEKKTSVLMLGVYILKSLFLTEKIISDYIQLNIGCGSFNDIFHQSSISRNIQAC